VPAMAAAVTPWPVDPSGGEPLPPADAYKIAVDEYRFQAQFNWSRTQYLLGLNVVVLVAGTGVASRPGVGAALVFAFGALAAALSASVVHTQHGYYRATRAHLQRVEDSLGVPADLRLDTTSTMAGATGG
jgi:hypothetical protein